MVAIRRSRPGDAARVIAIWRAAVEATHDFLTPADLEEIDGLVRAYLPDAPLWLAVDDQDRAIGFMGLSDAHMDALFIDPAARGSGIGRALVEHAFALHPVLTTDVNAQNAQAVGFYERLGFIPTGWSPTDDGGRPYPLIHLRRSASAPI